MNHWQKIEQLVKASKDFILTEEERQIIVKEEQQAYESNLPTINEVLKVTEKKLGELGFWVENNVHKDGLKFRFSLIGYYGPGGFTSQYHISGPLVLGIINPKGDEHQGFYANDIDNCLLIGSDFKKSNFEKFVLNQIENYLQPENLITNREQYERFRAILSG